MGLKCFFFGHKIVRVADTSGIHRYCNVCKTEFVDDC